MSVFPCEAGIVQGNEKIGYATLSVRPFCSLATQKPSTHITFFFFENYAPGCTNIHLTSYMKSAATEPQSPFLPIPG